jgi:hypothetical protein
MAFTRARFPVIQSHAAKLSADSSSEVEAKSIFHCEIFNDKVEVLDGPFFLLGKGV